MNTTRLLTTLAAAAALTGGIGFAYAQTTTGTTNMNSAGTTNSSPAVSNTSTTPAPMDNNATVADHAANTATARTERAPKADRG